MIEPVKKEKMEFLECQLRACACDKEPPVKHQERSLEQWNTGSRENGYTKHAEENWNSEKHTKPHDLNET